MSDPDNQTTTQEPNYLEEMVGEGKKYATVEDMAKGIVHANQFIDTLKAEKQEMADKLGIVEKQDDHLSQIVDLLKPKEEEPIIDTNVQTEPDVTITDPDPITPNIDLNPELNRQQFAKLAVDKYGDAKVAGEQLKQYIGEDQSRYEMAMSIMQTDPSALVRILPDIESHQLMDATGNTSMTTQPTNTTLPVTYSEAMKVFSEDRKLYQSPGYQAKIDAAQRAARAAGIDFKTT